MNASAHPEPPLLAIERVTKHFGSLTAVNGVSFEVRRGECLGLLGPNGAGKTTLLSVLAGLLRPDAGRVLIRGRELTGDTDPLKRTLGLAPQDLALYDELSARVNLLFFGSLYGLAGAGLAKAMAEALAIVELADRAGDKVKTFSGGMKRRLNLAAALLHDPELLLLDEPTVGVDPQSRNAIFENINALRRRGKTVLYTTHYMEEVERLCQRVVIMDHGQVIANDTLAGLKGRSAGRNRLSLELEGTPGGAWLGPLRAAPGVFHAEMEGQRLLVEVSDLSGTTPVVLMLLQQHGQRCVQLTTERANLEAVFLQLTGHGLRDK